MKQQEVSTQVAEQETAISALFRGKLTSTVACAGSPPSQTIEPFYMLLLHIQSDSVRSVAAALDNMTASETITDYKPGSVATKTVRLSRLPQVLVLQLVRADYGLAGSTKVKGTEGGGQRGAAVGWRRVAGCPGAAESRMVEAEGLSQRQLRLLWAGECTAAEILSYPPTPPSPLPPQVGKAVAFDFRLALRPAWLESKSKSRDRGAAYDLVATVSHHGKSSTSGHYTADVRQADGRWLRFDDGSVFLVSQQAVLADRPYMLFYERVQGGGEDAGRAAAPGPAAPRK